MKPYTTKQGFFGITCVAMGIAMLAKVIGWKEKLNELEKERERGM